ncbi:MAG: endonuclease III [bacterium]|nr:MAG: endonuclease III [bacterium]
MRRSKDSRIKATARREKAAPGKAMKEKANRVLSELKRLYPNPHHYLNFENPFQLLIATILSAQCTDEKVNEVTTDLFRRYPGPGDFAGEKLEYIEEAVRPTGFFRNKAKAIKGASEAIVERFGGKVPETMDGLCSLPGIARKSANAILQHGFSKVEGIVVDTHVIRLARRLGWSHEKDPTKIERDLMTLFDQHEWRWIPFYLKNHGRTICRAPTPRCGECVVSIVCPSALIEPPKK